MPTYLITDKQRAQRIKKGCRNRRCRVCGGFAGKAIYCSELCRLEDRERCDWPRCKKPRVIGVSFAVFCKEHTRQQEKFNKRFLERKK